MSEVPQKSLLGPIVFNIFVNHLDDGIDIATTKFANNSRLGEDIYMLESRTITDRSLGSLED